MGGGGTPTNKAQNDPHIVLFILWTLVGGRAGEGLPLVQVGPTADKVSCDPGLAAGSQIVNVPQNPLPWLQQNAKI